VLKKAAEIAGKRYKKTPETLRKSLSERHV